MDGWMERMEKLVEGDALIMLVMSQFRPAQERFRRGMMIHKTPSGEEKGCFGGRMGWICIIARGTAKWHRVSESMGCRPLAGMFFFTGSIMKP